MRGIGLLARYPSVIAQLPQGFAAASTAMEGKVVRAFERSPREFATVGGARVNLNPRNTLAQNASMSVAGWYEPPVSAIFSSLCRSEGCVIDVGANVGWYTFLAARRVGPNGLVLAYEPERENAQLLARTLHENPRRQVHLSTECLSDHEGDERLFLSEEAASFHSIARPVGPRSVTVPCTQVDTVVRARGIPRVDVLKVDVEGGEPKVLRGALASIRRGVVRHIILEWRPDCWSMEDELWNEVTARYRVYRIVLAPRLAIEVPNPTVERVSTATTAAGRHGKDLYLAPVENF